MNAALLTRPTTDRAFERLYRRHVHDVYRYVLAVLRNPADAEDATQATFLSAYRAFQRGDRPELPRNWLLKIAHNECRQRFRMLSRRPKEVEWDERVAAPAVDESIPSADEIRQALGHLNFNQRSALVMRELEGRSYSEIGEILDVSVSAVETLIFRARRALREQLEGGLTCGEAEVSLSRRLDGKLGPTEQRALRAHLRECRECASLERKQRAQRAALKRLGVVQLPPSLAGFFGGGGATVGGVVAGSGIAAKAAAVIAGAVIAGGVGHQAVEAVAAGDPPRTALPTLERVPAKFPKLYGASSAVWSDDEADSAAGGNEAIEVAFDAPTLVRRGVRDQLARARAGSGAQDGSARASAARVKGSPQPGTSRPSVTSRAPEPVQRVVGQAKVAIREARKVVPVPLPKPDPPKVELPRIPPPPPVEVPQLPPPPPVPLPPPPPLPGTTGG